MNHQQSFGPAQRYKGEMLPMTFAGDDPIRYKIQLAPEQVYYAEKGNAYFALTGPKGIGCSPQSASQELTPQGLRWTIVSHGVVYEPVAFPEV